MRAKMLPITIKYAFENRFRGSCLSVAQIMSMMRPTIGKLTRISVKIQSFNDICFSVSMLLSPCLLSVAIMVSIYPTIVYMAKLPVMLEITDSKGWTDLI